MALHGPVAASKRRTYILGGHQSDFSKSWSARPDALVALLTETLGQGLADVGLAGEPLELLARKNRIGGFVGNFNAPSFLGQGHLGAFLGTADRTLVGMPAARYEAACASGSVALEAADAAIRAGQLDVALVVGVEVMRTVSPVTANAHLSMAAPRDEAEGVSFFFPRIFGSLTELIQERATERHGPSAPERVRGALSEISRLNYENAGRNPRAQTRDAFVIDDWDSRMAALDRRFAESLGSSTRYRDCSQVTDGACLLVLASEDLARDFAHRGKPPVAAISGRGRRTAGMRLSDRVREFREAGPHECPLPWTRRAVLEAFADADRSVASIDVFETHDCFTSSEYLALSVFGLCAPGAELEYIEEGRLRSGKSINASGGLIGCGHPVGATGVRMALDLYRQVTGTAGAYQVEGARAGAMLNIGGSFATNACFVVERASP